MMGAVIHTLSKNNIKDIDLSAPSVMIAENESPAAKNAIEKTATYKKFFENTANLTLHNTEYHHSFFETNRFKTFTKEIEDKQEFPLKKENFSDFGIQTLNFYRNFLFDTEQKIKDIPRGNAVQIFGANSPNSYKAYHYTQHDTLGADQSASPKSAIKSSLKDGVFSETQGDASSKKYNAFKYFNFNMTAAIQVFRGSGAHPKKDIWSLLTPQDMDFSENKVLFCRIKYWNKKLIGDLEIPIIDKYFLIYPGATASIPIMTLPETNFGILITLKDNIQKPVDPARNSSGRSSDQSLPPIDAAPEGRRLPGALPEGPDAPPPRNPAPPIPIPPNPETLGSVPSRMNEPNVPPLTPQGPSASDYGGPGSNGGGYGGGGGTGGSY